MIHKLWLTITIIQVAVYVRLGKGKTLNADDLRKFALDRITHFKVPKYVKFVEHYPLTVTGKVRKVELRQMALSDFELDV